LKNSFNDAIVFKLIIAVKLLILMKLLVVKSPFKKELQQ